MLFIDNDKLLRYIGRTIIYVAKAVEKVEVKNATCQDFLSCLYNLKPTVLEHSSLSQKTQTAP
jgi:hypothetical protein